MQILTRRVWMMFVVFAMVPVRVDAQTGLLFVANAELRDRVEAVADQVPWRYGPKALALASPEQLASVDSTLVVWCRDTVAAVVIVPIAAGLDSRLTQQLRRMFEDPSDGTVLVASAVSLPTGEKGLLEVAVRAEAARGYEALVARGAVQGPTSVYRLSPVNVTATRTARDVFNTPMSVTVLGDEMIRERTPNGAADLFREVPGLDVIGVGTSQPRPVIRGLLGQRILLLQDGVRLGNSRREQDRSEAPTLVDISRVERYEVVRGASSILYGSDAIGGVVNMIVRRPDWTAGDGIRGAVGYRYSTADRQSRPTGELTGTIGQLAVRAAGSYRRADPYRAPTGSFGAVTLDSATRVEDTGVRDYTLEGYLGYRLTSSQTVYARYERYAQEEGGFGFVEPAALDSALSRIQILFPNHDFDKITAGYEGTDLRLPVFNDINVVGYGPGTITTRSENYTDLKTYGFRIELGKWLGGKHRITYGADFFRDRSENTDTSTTTREGFGPTTVTGRGTPRVPFARFNSLGVFAQGDIEVTSRLHTVLGLRYQYVRTNTEPTPGVTDPLVRASDQTVVGAANVQYRIADAVHVVGSVGRAFRSPNLVERFFNGPSPEGRGWWTRNPTLQPETSWNIEGGVKVRSRRLHATAFLFRNSIRNGIAIRPTGDSVGGVAEFQNVNVDELRFSGIEVAAGVAVWNGVSLNGGFTRIWTGDLVDSTVFVGESYSSRLTASVRYTEPQGRVWAEYGLRRQGERDDVDLGNSPVGPVIPAFTVHFARAGVRLLRRYSLTVGVENLTNRLYAEAPNVAFFRPEPRRNLILSVRSEF